MSDSAARTDAGSAIRVRCACGWETVGPEDAAVADTQEHGRRLHNMTATRDQVLAMAAPVEPQDDALDVTDNPAAQRYEARIGDAVVGFSEYRLIKDRVVFLHTEVDPSMEGRGIGSRLAAGALDDVRARGRKLTAKCPFIAAYLQRHREYEDLIA